MYKDQVKLMLGRDRASDNAYWCSLWASRLNNQSPESSWRFGYSLWEELVILASEEIS